ncbi:hypothetical protein GGF38_006330, partial [Coemansia sp. RSA 25]
MEDPEFPHKLFVFYGNRDYGHQRFAYKYAGNLKTMDIMHHVALIGNDFTWKNSICRTLTMRHGYQALSIIPEFVPKAPHIMVIWNGISDEPNNHGQFIYQWDNANTTFYKIIADQPIEIDQEEFY